MEKALQWQADCTEVPSTAPVKLECHHLSHQHLQRTTLVAEINPLPANVENMVSSE